MAVEFLAHPAAFTRTTQSCRLCGIRCVSNCTAFVLNYSLSNACASKSRGSLHKLNRHAAVEFLAHPARFERAVPAFGGRCSIQLSHGCITMHDYIYLSHKINKYKFIFGEFVYAVPSATSNVFQNLLYLI